MRHSTKSRRRGFLERLESRDLLATLTDPMLVGGVSDDSANIFLRTNVAAQVAVQYSTSPTFASPRQTAAVPTTSAKDYTTIVELENLAPETKYYYRAVVGGVVASSSPVHSFSTFPVPGTAGEFSFAVLADLQKATSTSTVKAPAYQSLAEDGPAFVMQIGDFDHRNPQTLKAMRNMHRQVRSAISPAGADFAQFIAPSYPLFHIWDDHDFGTNNADKTFPGRADALQAFNEYYPTPDRPNAAGIWHSYEFGQAEFFMLDVRSQADRRTDPDGPSKSMLDGNNIANGQLAWLKQGLLDSNATWKFLVSGVTFNPDTKPDDAWGAYGRERQELLDFINANGIENVIVISGDLHTGGALDDGTNADLPEISAPHTNLSTSSISSGPVGTWSHGVTSGAAGGGYGWITVSPDGVMLEARAANGTVRRQLSITAKDSAATFLSISPTSANKSEGNTGVTPFAFTVARSGEVSGSTTVNYAATGSGAAAANAEDFGGALPRGTIIFAPYQSSRIITINVSGDTTSEANESFNVTLTGPSPGAQITSASAAGVIQNDDAAPPEAGLVGQYFNDLNLTNLAHTRTDPAVNFPQDWGNAPPGTSVAADDNYSVRWTGLVETPTTGLWTFFTTSNDGVRLWIDNVLVIDNWTSHAVTQNSAALSLAAGWHSIRLDYFQKAGIAEITLSYQGPVQVKTIIPNQRLRTKAPEPPPVTPATFVDVTATSGIAPLANVAYGVEAFDFNDDSFVDLYIGKHLDGAAVGKKPNLWINQRDGTWIDQFDLLFPSGIGGDTHGNQWVDFDNDGNADLFQVRGAQGGSGEGSNSLYVNEGGHFVDRAIELGLELPLGRARDPLWFDWNKDGLLDVLVANDKRPDGLQPSVLMQQMPSGGFQDVTAAARLDFNGFNADAFRVSDLNGDALDDIVLMQSSNHPLIFWAGQPSGGFHRQDGFLPIVGNVHDLVIGDFNGDQYNDLFLARSNLNVPEVVLLPGNRIAASLRNRTNELGFTFKTSGNITFEFRKEQIKSGEISANKVLLGTSGAHPAALPFTISDGTPNIAGIKVHSTGAGDGLYIGFNVATQTWEVRFSDDQNVSVDFFLRSTAAITDVKKIGFTANDAVALAPLMLVFNPQSSQFVDQSIAAGLATPIAAPSAVGLDYDNDKDLDIYIAAETAVAGLPDRIYVNQGDGTFANQPVPVTSLSFGPHTASFGDGTKVLTTDFDNDGYVDMFLNGTKFSTPSTIYDGSPHQLLANQGSGNHWIEIKLQGTDSNREAIGTKVMVTSGGVTQMRENSGGKHRQAKDDATIHFGIGADPHITQVIVKWPSGNTQTLNNVSVDQILTITEPSSTSVLVDRYFSDLDLTILAHNRPDLTANYPQFWVYAQSEAIPDIHSSTSNVAKSKLAAVDAVWQRLHNDGTYIRRFGSKHHLDDLLMLLSSDGEHLNRIQDLTSAANFDSGFGDRTALPTNVDVAAMSGTVLGLKLEDA